MTVRRAGLTKAAWPALLLALAGCPRSPHSGAEVDPPDASGDTGEVQPPEKDEGLQACGVAMRFADLEWVPDDARLVTAIELGHSEAGETSLAAALALLAGAAADHDLALPVLAAMDYQNLGLQLGNLRMILRQLEHAPAQLVEVQGPGGELVWSWAIDCGPEILSARLLARWQLSLRVDLEHPGVRLALGDPERFPFDVIVFADRQVALTMVGRGRSTLAWLSGDGAGSSNPAQGEALDPPGVALEALADAPVRSVLRGEWLLAGVAQSAAGDPERAHARTLRATATTLEVDGKPWASP